MYNAWSFRVDDWQEVTKQRKPLSKAYKYVVDRRKSMMMYLCTQYEVPTSNKIDSSIYYCDWVHKKKKMCARARVYACD